MKPFSWSLISSFALKAAASPLAAPEMLLNGRGMLLIKQHEIQKTDPGLLAAITASTMSTLDLYAQYAGASYCNSENAIGSVVTCSSSACPDVTAAGAKIAATFSGSTTDIQGFLSTDATNKVIVLSVRGSHSIRNWITDFEFLQQSCSLVSGCLVHSGFAKAWDEISGPALSALKAAAAANPSYKIVFTGHSLGAAVSSLGAAYARAQGYAVDIINYGSPRVGNAAFAAFVTNQPGVEYRVTHLDDPVPRLPPIVFDYAHTSPEYWLSDGTATTEDYGAADVKLCTGYTALGCNAGTLGLDIEAHLYYLGPIAGCSPVELAFKKRQSDDDFVWWQATAPAQDVTDDELEAQLNAWVQQDMAQA
ncbi:extracellular lipase [Xylariaceae sp. FL1651]|nr:extracellular lipase [Xylariaceae sp. FL1651]